MTISYGHDVFSLAPGESIFVDTVFNSSDFNAGGDYHGPLVVAGIAMTPNQILTPSTVGLEFKAQTSEFTTNCVYHYSIRNDSSDRVSFVIHKFYN
jgi:hypothetical protein